MLRFILRMSFVIPLKQTKGNLRTPSDVGIIAYDNRLYIVT